eukprot:m.172952 g.172952  ORF g.172952 m.172952 type:complete len:307 (-) comp25232_c0_seq1:396-1316(-)
MGLFGNVPWSRLIPYIWIATIVIVVFGCLPWGIYELRQDHQQTHVQAWFVAGIFVCLAVPISIWDVALHLHHWNNKPLQRRVVRIIWMVPIYAVNSWLALRFIGAGLYLDTARECYEAYVIYNFYGYMLEFLSQQENFAQDLETRPDQPHVFPLCWMKPWKMGRPFIHYCTNGVVSYIVVRPLTTIIALVCAWAGKYEDGKIETDDSFLYLAVINSISQAWAMYCLILFYLAFKKDLAPVNPLGKMLTIKAVVFFSFWQSVLIAILVKVDAIKEDPRWTTYNKELVAAGLQDFLVHRNVHCFNCSS